MPDFAKIYDNYIRETDAARAGAAVTPDGQLPTADFSQTPATAKAVLRSSDPVKEAPVFEEMGIGERMINAVGAGWHNRLKSEALTDAYNYQQMADGGLSALVDEEEEDASVSALMAKDTKASRDFKAKYESRAEESIYDLIDLQKEDAKHAAPTAIQNASKAAEGKGFIEGVSAGFSEIAKDPLNSLIYLGGSSFGAIAPEIGMSIVPGIGIARVAKLPTIARAVQGAIMASGSYNAELGSYMLDKMQEQGVDLRDADSIKAALSDPKMADLYQKAKARATVVAALDGASGALSSIHVNPSNAVRHLREAASFYKEAKGINMTDAWRLTSAPATKTRAAAIGKGIENIVTQAAVQGVAGGAGEALGSLAAGDEINWAEVLFEAVGELVSAPTEVLTLSASVNAEFKNQEQAAATAKAAGDQWGKVTQAVAAMATKVQNGATVQQWANDLGQDRVVFAFAQDLIDNGTAEKIRAVNPELADRIEKVAAEKSDIAIPVSEVVGVAAKDEALAQSIVYDSRVDPAGMTPRQADEFQKTGKEEAAKAFAKVIDIAKPDIDTRKAIDTEVKKIRDQLVAAGTAKEVADLQVMPWGAWLATRCATLGKAPEEVMKTINLRIQRGEQNNAASLSQVPSDTALDKREPLVFDWGNNEVSRESRPGAILDAVNFAFDGAPIATLEGTEFQKSQESLVDRVLAYYTSQYNGVVRSPEIGDVVLNKVAVKDSIAHGIGSKKAAAFAAVPMVITNGKLFGVSTNWKGRGQDAYMIAAPILIGGERYLCEVVVQKRKTSNRFYLHEVNLISDVTATLQDHYRGGQQPSPARPVRSILVRMAVDGNVLADGFKQPLPSRYPTAKNKTEDADNEVKAVNDKSAVDASPARTTESLPSGRYRVSYGKDVKKHIGKSQARKAAIDELLKLMSTEYQKEFVLQHQAPSQIAYQKAINDAVRKAAKKAGVNLEDKDDPVTRDLVVTTIINDALYAINVNPTAVGWYDEKVRKCLSYAGIMFPELDPNNEEFDKNELFKFLYITATTSNGLKVKQNMNLAVRIYREYKKTGTIPAWGEGTQMEPMVKTLSDFGVIESTFDSLDQMRKFFTTNWSVGQLLLMGYKISGEGANEIARGAAIIGPKIGNGFFSNLNGLFDALTMDRWFMRTFGRWTGTLIDFSPDGFVDKVNKFRAVLEDVRGNKEFSAWLKDNAGFDVEAALKMKTSAEAMVKAEMSLKTPSSPFVKLAKKTAAVFMPSNYRKAYGALWGTKDQPDSIGWRFYSALKAVERASVSDKVAPGGSGERKYIRGLFNESLDVLHGIPGVEKLTMADLQAVLWYAEKKIYEATPVGAQFVEDYSAEDAPDYANVMRDIALANGATEDQIKQATKRVDDAIETERVKGSERARFDSLDGKEKIRVFGSRGFGSLRRDKGLSVEDGAKPGQRSKAVYREEREVDGAGVRSSDGGDIGGVSKADGEETGRNGGGVRVLKPVATWSPGAKVSAVLKTHQILKGRDQKSATPVFLEYAPTERAANDFLAALKEAKKKLGPAGACVEEKSVEELTGNDEWKSKCRIFLSKDKQCGFVIKNGDDLVSVFSAKDSNSGDAVVECAIAAGARRLDCFNTILPGFYALHGFVPVARLRFNRDYAPYDWDYKFYDEYNKGEPDIVFMVYDNNRQKTFSPEELDDIPYTDGEAYGEPYVSDAVDRLKETNRVVEEAATEAREGAEKQAQTEDFFTQAKVKDDAGAASVFAQTAYHGSPYQFDKFTLDHIGSGEGAQAHGWGLYFALDKRVAEEYRARLTEDNLPDTYEALTTKVDSITESWGEKGFNFSGAGDVSQVYGAIFIARTEGKDSAVGRVVGDYTIVESTEEARQARASGRDEISVDELMELDSVSDDDRVSDMADAMDVINSMDYSFRAPYLVRDIVWQSGYRDSVADLIINDLADGFVEQIPGSLYTVEIPDDDVMLREEADFEDQPQEVKDGILEIYSIIKGNRWEVPDIYAFKDPSRAYELFERAYNLYKDEDLSEQVLRPRIGDVELALGLLSNSGKIAVKEAMESVRAQAIRDRGTDKKPLMHGHLDEMTGGEILSEIEEEFGGPQRAAEVLREHGVMGVRYKGQRDGECAVVWSEDAIKMRNYLEQSMEKDYRGAFVPSNAVNVSEGLGGIMRLMESSDKSTFLHESAHAWLDADTMLAKEIADKAARGEELTEGEKRFLNNLGGFFRWGQQEGVIDLGVTDDPESVLDAARRWASMTTTEQTGMHELFAEGFESYLLDGVAPNNEMRSVFGRFKHWLMNIYQQATRRPRPISHEVRKLFDLMFATEQQAQQTETRLGLRALLLGKDAQQALSLSDEEVQAFKDLDDQATAECAGLVAKHIRGTLRLYGRVRKSKLRELRQTEKAAIDKKEAELREEPRYIAVQLLTTGIPGEDGKRTRMKLSRSSLVGIPVEAVDNLSNKGFIAEEGGVPVEALANAAGTTDAFGLIGDLLEISGVGDARVEAERFVAYQQAQDGVDFELTAELAAHNATRSRFLTAEYNAVARALGSRQVLVNTAREVALEQVGGMKVSDLYPSAYMAAERRCAKDAETAMAKGDLAAVLEAKRGQIMNYEMARAALDAQADYTRLQRAAKRAAKSATIHPKYKKVLFALLDAHSVNNLTAAQREQFAADAIDPEEVEKIVASMEEAGTPIEGLRELLMDRRHARDMVANDVRDLYAVVKQIETLGRNVYKQNLINGKRRISDIVDECKEAIKDAAAEQGREANENQRVPMTRMERLKDNMSKFLAEHMKISALCRIMDRNKDGGVMWRTFVNSANQCATLENSLRQKIAQTLAEKLLPVFKRGFEEDPVNVQGFDRPFTHGMRIAVALNWGNESNRKRLLEGDTRFTPEALAQIFEHLTEADWRAVESVWKAFEDLRPMVAAKEERVYGTQPEWIDYSPFAVKTAEGKTITVSGGYYPVKFDPRGSNRAGMYADAETVKQEMQGAFQSATTRRSFTKSRVKGEVRMPLRLDLAGLYEGFTDVIHDLAWHEWLIDTGRVLRGVDGDGTGVRKAINDHYGHNIARQFEDWRKDIATGGRDMGASDWIARFSRNVGVAAMGYSLTSAIVQMTGIGYVVPRVGFAATTAGLVKYLANPVKARRNIDKLSEAMRLRGITQNREISQIKNRIDGKQGWLYNHAYTIMQWVQNVVDSIAWMAAYERYSRDGFDTNDAVRLADQLVIDTQSSGNINDLSAIERNRIMRPFTVFYSFMNAALNLNLVEAMGEKNRAKAYAKICFMSVIMPIAEGYLREAIKAGGDDDDLDEDEMITKQLRKSAGAVVDYNIGLFAILREVSNVAKGIVADEPIYGYNGPAGVRPIVDVAKFAQAASSDPFSWAALSATVNLAGDFTGAPSVQINRTIKGIRAIESGQAEGIDAITAPLFGYSGRIDE